MHTRKLHSWDISYSQAIALQKQLAQQVQQIELRSKPKTIAGLDCALSSDKQRIIAAAVVVLKIPNGGSPKRSLGMAFRTSTIPKASGFEAATPKNSEFEVIETATASQKLSFPYIPGLLSFRESPVCLSAVEKLKKEPDAFMIDGQGVAHPRRFGLAAHLGLFFDKPTIGCAKSRLTGYFEDPPPEKGAYSFLRDKKSYQTDASDERRTTSDEIIGAVVRTRSKVEPVFVSVGNKCLLEDAIEITLAWTTKYRLPEPTRLAHQLVSKLKLEA